MLFNCGRCRALTPELVNTASGLHLHQLRWLEDADIGPLPEQWNVLVGVQPVPDDARILHYTLGGPWFEDCTSIDCAADWHQAQRALNHPISC